MLNWIADVLEPNEINTITSSLAEGEFTDGRITAGGRAKRVKRNLQLKKTPAQADELNELVIAALQRNKMFRMIAIPKRVHRPLFSRYQEGMRYGNHVDDALMDKPNTLRTDLAVTVFLNDPEHYDGGELVIETSLGEQMVKLPKGDAIVYPASTLHSVAPVTRGERLAAVTWVQSYVRDPARREILTDLDRIRKGLGKSMPNNKETDLAHKTYSNLLRMWADV